MNKEKLEFFDRIIFLGVLLAFICIATCSCAVNKTDSQKKQDVERRTSRTFDY